MTYVPVRLLNLLFVLLSLLLFLGCSKSEKAPPEVTRTYTVRGIVKQIPIEGNRNSELLIKHEAIPTFVSPEGTVVGMSSMTMPFRVKSPSLLTGITVGDEVEFQLEVRWGDDPLDHISSITKLPPGTVKF